MAGTPNAGTSSYKSISTLPPSQRDAFDIHGVAAAAAAVAAISGTVRIVSHPPTLHFPSSDRGLREVYFDVLPLLEFAGARSPIWQYVAHKLVHVYKSNYPHCDSLPDG